eukprot:m.679471 g.679471  ORF g.679471 m.679471 type:complete len:80 (+) comp58583_c0_seq4:2070-2309(+)
MALLRGMEQASFQNALLANRHSFLSSPSQLKQHRFRARKSQQQKKREKHNNPAGRIKALGRTSESLPDICQRDSNARCS